MIFEKFQLDWLGFTEINPETLKPKFYKTPIIFAKFNQGVCQNWFPEIKEQKVLFE